MVFRILVKQSRRILLESFVGIGTEDDVDKEIERLMAKWPDCDVTWDEVDEVPGRIVMRGHPIDGMLASEVSKLPSGNVNVRLQESRGVFRPGDVVTVGPKEFVQASE
jgi:hypothetical protein